VDPTTHNRQGNDVGTQYRSVLFYHSEAQRAAAEKKVEEVNAALAAGTYRKKGAKVATTIEPATDYYIAEVRLHARACRVGLHAVRWAVHWAGGGLLAQWAEEELMLFFRGLRCHFTPFASWCVLMASQSCCAGLPPTIFVQGRPIWAGAECGQGLHRPHPLLRLSPHGGWQPYFFEESTAAASAENESAACA
jgi:hypothetical protein